LGRKTGATALRPRPGPAGCRTLARRNHVKAGSMTRRGHPTFFQEPAPFGVPPLGGQGSNVEGVGHEYPALESFPGPQAINVRPAKAGTPNPSGSWAQLASIFGGRPSP
jgi:hypothetical protein